MEWWRYPNRRPATQSAYYNNTTLHITANTYSSPGYIRVQWPWIGMKHDNTYVVIATYNIHGSESPWWGYTKDHDLHKGWRYTIDQDLHSGWKYLTYTGTSHESWNLMNTGTIKQVAYKRCHPSGRSSTQTATSTCPTMRIEVSRSNIVVHRLITGHWCIPLTDARSPTDNENGNQGTRVQTNKCK